MKILIVLSYLAFALSLVMTGIGGLLDITEQDRIGFVSRQHAWHDGLYLLVVAIFLRCIAR
jgi:hypothetical protein